MSEFLEILTHARRFKAAVKDLSVEELRDLASKLEKIVTEREEEAAEEAKAQADRLAKIEEIRQQMESVGLSVEDLGVVTAVKPTKKRAPRPAKYKIEVAGETITWTGQGRMPTVFKTEVEKGRSMDDFLID
ncbi:H-NS histone family protein [Shewanella yunxiaonensis]|uniref:DNA-binding protein n=1 Tax=Shewanella yunxiaonensis TaxID=2829809 RepID=A0ABX7YX76_9GAMM|nr:MULTISPECIES: H-NS family nucleoid-associated regulatory protein [Shewanella]MDF0532889.1 H-NS family nucleoid-associated regulatory protein [Shewanella sp. A32]QUN06771.1 H-NS histone family protein [Shewanella yunxiaonensis]